MVKFEKIEGQYFYEYMEMIKEWKQSNTVLTPDILEMPCDNIDE